MIKSVRGDPPARRALSRLARLGCAALLVVCTVYTPAMAEPSGRGGGHGGGGGHSGGAHGGGQRGGGGGGGGHRGGRGGYGGWGGGYYPGPAVVFGSPYYCEPPLVYVPDYGYNYCE